MKYYLTTDTHFGHDILMQYSGRPEGFSDLILENIIQTPHGEADVLIHLGDICIGKDTEWHKRLNAARAVKRNSDLIKRG